MKRRALIIAAAALPAVTWKQPSAFGQAKKQPLLIGMLIVGPRAEGGMAAFREELASRGWKEGVQLAIEVLYAKDSYEPGLQRLSQQGMQALASMPSPMLSFNRKEILRFAAGHRWPVISNNTGWVRDGALLSYGAQFNAQLRRAAYYVDRILRGAKPADLPIELPTTFDMAVNLKTAKALGLTLPPQIMVRANVVIE